MVKEFKTLNLLDILPESIRGDPKIQAAAGALDAELQAVTEDIKENLLISRIDELPEKVLDLLAWQWHVDFYRPLGMDIDTKRRLIRESIAWHRIKGTPAAVEKVLAAAFVESWVEEWYEYGGSPGYFRVTISDVITDPEQQADILAAINSAKNERSWLEALRYLLVLKDELTASDLLALLEETGFIERYPWQGRFANGAYLAGGEHGEAFCDGTYQANGTIRANGAAQGEQNPPQVWPNIANGEYQANGSICAKCWNHTGLIYANSVGMEVFVDMVNLFLSDLYKINIWADGRFRADGTFTAGYDNPMAEAFTDTTSMVISDTESATEKAGGTLAAHEAEEVGLVKLFYADGAFYPGKPITADGSRYAGGIMLADAFDGLTSEPRKPKLANGQYKANGAEKPRAVTINARANSDENLSSRIVLTTEEAAAETCSTAERNSTNVVTPHMDTVDTGTMADGHALADGSRMAAGHMMDDALTLAYEPCLADNVGDIYADGTAKADGTMMAMAADDNFAITVGMGLTANGMCLANAAGARRADGEQRADGGTFAAQIYNARFKADGSIKADGAHFTGFGGAVCDYKYLAA